MEEQSVNVNKELSPFQRNIRRFFRNRLTVVGLILVSLVVITSVLAPVIAPYPESITGEINFTEMNQPPSSDHVFGTDDIGRDVLSRVLYGGRYSLIMAVSVLTIALAIGVPLGLIAGYFGGTVNMVIMRITDIFLSIPSILMAMVITAILGPGLFNSIIGIACCTWPWYTRLVEGETKRIKNEQFIRASEAVGASKWRTIFHEILPNCMPTIIVKTTSDMGSTILLGASLGFLGLGVQPPTPEWGSMVAEARTYLPTIWWSTIFPGLAILMAVLGFNLLGDGLRDLYDVQLDQ